MAGPTTAVLDDANRANAGPPASANWSDLNSGIKVVSNQFAANGTNSFSYWNASSPGPACECYGLIPTKPTNGNSVAFQVRGKDTGSIATFDCYQILGLAQAGTDIIRMQIITNAGATTVGADISQEISNGNGLLIRANGSSFDLDYFNGTSWSNAGTRTDSTYSAAGRVGLAISDTTARVDDFGGGTYIPLAIPVAMAQYRQRWN